MKLSTQPQDPNYFKISGLIKIQNSLNKLVNDSANSRQLYSEKNTLIQKAKAIFGAIDFVGLESGSDILNNAVKLNKSIVETGVDIDALLKFRLLGHNILKKTDSEGLFRLSGSKNQVEVFLKELDKDINPKTIQKTQDVNTLTGAFKQLVRERSPGLLDGVKLVKDVKGLKEAVQKLKVIDRKLLNVVIRCLSEVAKKSTVNKMTAGNLATCMAPNLVEIVVDENNPLAAFAKTKESNDIVQFMIEHYAEIFK